MEIWKDIEGYEGLYQISNEGNVRNTRNNKLLHQADLRGYKRVGLSKNNKVFWKQVHRLVANAFIENPHNKPQVDHINTIRDDNRVENLRWATISENNLNPITLAKHIETFTNREDQSKKVGQYTTDDMLVKVYPSISETGREGYCIGCVSKCARGERMTHKGFKWKFIND